MASACYVFAILPREICLPPGLTGFGGVTLSLVPCGALAAAICRMDPGRIQSTTENVLHHAAIVEELRQRGSALPVRFGTVLPDADAVVGALAKHSAILEAEMARLGDKVEFGLTVLWNQSPGNDEENGGGDDGAPAAGEVTKVQGAGARYLQARLAKHRREAAARERAKALERDLDRVLSPYVLEHSCTILPTPRLPVRAAYLLDPARVQGFQEMFEELRRVHPDLRLLLSGPWPPYSFVKSLETAEQSIMGKR